MSVYIVYFARSVFTFFLALRFSHLRFITFKLRESLIEMEILIKHSFLHLFILQRSKCGNCDITYVLSIFVTSINNNNRQFITPVNQEGNYFLKDIDENHKHESLLVSVQLRLSYQSFDSLQRASCFLRSYVRAEMYKLCKSTGPRYLTRDSRLRRSSLALRSSCGLFSHKQW